jgi:integrase
MTVYLPKGGKTWYYDYRYKGQRFRGSTEQLTRADAALVESQIKLRQRQQAGGIAAFDVQSTPRFQRWAEVYFKYQTKFVDRPDLVRAAIEVVLEFWGAPPAKAKRQPTGTNTRRIPAPYHDLRLGHPIAVPSWITKFEAWIEARGVSGSTRNTYLSTLSGMYRVAREPQFRHVSQVPSNPFTEIRRSRRHARVVALPVDAVKRWIEEAPPHVRHAMAIAALAPKFRLQTILALEWGVHVTPDLTQIVVYAHKTRSAAGGAPQVTPVGVELRAILEALRGKLKSGPVIRYRGVAVDSIKTATRKAAERAGLKWGVRDGVTFHTIRHSIATLLAELGIGERLRMELMGHKEIRTTQQYTHLAAATQVAPHAQLAAALAIKDVVQAPYFPRRRGRSAATGKTLGTPPQKGPKTPANLTRRKTRLKRVR